MPISDVIEMMATRRGQEMPQIPDMLGTLQQAIQLRQQQEQQQFSNQIARDQEGRLQQAQDWRMQQSPVPGELEEPSGKAGQARPNRDEIIDKWTDKLAELVAAEIAVDTNEAAKLLPLKQFTEMYLADWQPPEPQKPTPRTREMLPYAAALGQGLKMPARR